MLPSFYVFFLVVNINFVPPVLLSVERTCHHITNKLIGCLLSLFAGT